MKPIIMFLIAFMSFSIGAFAQSVMIPASDTNTNAQTTYVTSYSLPSNTGNFSLQYVGTKISGTVAGTVLLQGSLDGVNYTSVADTLTLSDQAVNTKIWDVSGSKRIKWRFEITTTGTNKIASTGYYTERK